MAVFITVVNPPWRAVQRVPSANNPLSASACPRDSSATGANRASLALPLPRQPLQLNQNLLYVLHALSDAIGDGGRDRPFIVAGNAIPPLPKCPPLPPDAPPHALPLPP